MPLSPSCSTWLTCLLGSRDHETTDRLGYLTPSGAWPLIISACGDSNIAALTVTLESSESDVETRSDDAEGSYGMMVELDEDIAGPVPETEYDDTVENVEEGGTNPCGDPMRPVRRACEGAAFTNSPPVSSPTSVSPYSLSESKVGEAASITITGPTGPAPCLRSFGVSEPGTGEDKYGRTGV